MYSFILSAVCVIAVLPELFDVCISVSTNYVSEYPPNYTSIGLDLKYKNALSYFQKSLFLHLSGCERFPLKTSIGSINTYTHTPTGKMLEEAEPQALTALRLPRASVKLTYHKSHLPATVIPAYRTPQNKKPCFLDKL